MKLALVTGVALVAFASLHAGHAGQIISFGQVSGTNDVTITANGTGTATTIGISDAAVLIDQLMGATTPPAIPAFMDMAATSIDNAVPVGPAILQHYAGSFCLSSAAACGGTIDLEGTFSDAAFGLGGGTQLSVNVANPPDTLAMSSGVIPAADLIPPSSFTLSMSNLGTLAIDNVTLASTTASFSGVASANEVPEPASMALLGLGLLGLTAVRYSRGTGPSGR